MLRQKCSYRNDIETCEKPKSKEKLELKFGIYQKQVNAKFPAENADIWWLQWKCHVIFKNICLLFWKFLSYLKCVLGFESIYSSYISRKNYDGSNFTPTPPSPPSDITRSKYVGGNRVKWTYWAFWYIELQAIF